MNNPRKNYSIDGFVPSSRGRHAGLAPRQSSADQAAGRQPIRRPGLHGTLPSANRHAADTQIGNPNTRLPEFTSYTGPAFGAPSQATPRQRGRRRDEQAIPSAKSGKRSWKKIVKRSAAVLGLFLLLCGGWLSWKFLHANSAVFGNSSLIGFLSSTPLKGEDKGRTNILLAGVSTDDPGHEGANLTDSIMLMSLDTKNHKAILMSIPRDLWVNIPGYGHSKINAANAFGDSNKFSEPGYPSGGMGLLEQTLSQTLQLPIHYYVRVNYSALRDAVNAVGGVEINIQSEDKRGLYDPNISAADHGPLRLKNGEQKINGQTALNLSRARGDPTNDGRVAFGFPRSDFDRTQHQRQLMLALKDRIVSPDVIANPLKLGQLFDVVGKNVKTDFKPSEIRRLYDLSKQTNNSNITSVSLNDANGKNLLANYSTADGAAALIPSAGLDDYSQIVLYIKKLTTNNPVIKENPSVVVLNGGNIDGLASKESNVLTSKGMTVESVGDGPATKRTIIIDNTKGKKPASLQALTSRYGNNVTTKNTTSYATSDFVVILGAERTMPAGTSDSAN